MSLPSGTITFLFTDIEGSTELWEKYPEAMRAALTRHDFLLHSAIEANNGVVFKTIGDAFCAAFPTAPDALKAALDAQIALYTASWPDSVAPKVRMALNTGAVELRDNDYFGQSLNRVARLISTGHGGQVLISAATQELVRDVLPPACSLQNLGAHRLRDLARPETVFQLLHPDLPSEFPPLRSLDNPELPNNLPQQLTSFIGREKAMAEVKSLLAKTRLLTLTGTGGCGKTRLSLQIAADVLEDHPDGGWLVELAPLANPALIPQTVAQVLGLKDQAGQTIQQTLTDSLKSKRLLLLLDNCEHVLSACAQLTAALLRSCPQVKVIATSREPLGVSGEQTYRVPSLSLPDPKQPSSPQSVSQYEAVRLFIERAMLVKPDFAVSNANAPALAQVCHRLDGIPLAIELAAARVRSLPVEDINARLDNRFRLLTGGDRAALPRQQTLRAAIDWSYDLLMERERTLLRGLSVFAGGWTLKAAEMVCASDGSTDWEVLDLLTALVDKSLVIYEEREGKARYRLLETVQQYARDKLVEAGRMIWVRRQHCNFFLALAEEAEAELQGPEQVRWLDILDAEHQNLHAALQWCLEEPDGAQTGLRLVLAIRHFWSTRGYFSDGRMLFERVLTQPGAQQPTALRAKALAAAGSLAQEQGDTTAAQSLYEESLAIWRELGDKRQIAYALGHLGFVPPPQTDHEAERLFSEGLAIGRELGDKHIIAWSLNNLADIVHMQGDYTTARSLHEESLTIYRELGLKVSIAYTLMKLGIVARHQHNYEVARILFEEALALDREIGHRQWEIYNLGNLGLVAQEQHDYAKARAYFEESLAVNREVGNRSMIAESLDLLAELAREQCDYATAGSLLAQSLAIRRELRNKFGVAWSLQRFASIAAVQRRPSYAARLWGAAEALGVVFHPSEREKHDLEVDAIYKALGEEAFMAAWAEGRAMTLEQAIEYALEEAET